jgi:hypothetical protein
MLSTQNRPCLPGQWELIAEGKEMNQEDLLKEIEILRCSLPNR